MTSSVRYELTEPLNLLTMQSPTYKNLNLLYDKLPDTCLISLYSQAQAAQNNANTANEKQGDAKSKDDHVVDADFEVVDDKNNDK